MSEMSLVKPDESRGVDPSFNQGWPKRRIVIITCAILLLIPATVIVISIQRTLARRTEVMQDFRALHDGFVAYSVDHSWGSPPDTLRRGETTSTGRITFECEPILAIDFQSRTVKRMPQKDAAFYAPLSTPIAYVKPPDMTDPFRDGELYSFTSWAWPLDGDSMSIVQSPGPDQRDDYPIDKIRADMDILFKEFPYDPQGPRKTALEQQIAPYLYDPTNGLRSSGDFILLYYQGETWGS